MPITMNSYEEFLEINVSDISGYSLIICGFLPLDSEILNEFLYLYVVEERYLEYAHKKAKEIIRIRIPHKYKYYQNVLRIFETQQKLDDEHINALYACIGYKRHEDLPYLITQMKVELDNFFSENRIIKIKLNFSFDEFGLTPRYFYSKNINTFSIDQGSWENFIAKIFSWAPEVTLDFNAESWKKFHINLKNFGFILDNTDRLSISPLIVSIENLLLHENIPEYIRSKNIKFLKLDGNNSLNEILDELYPQNTMSVDEIWGNFIESIGKFSVESLVLYEMPFQEKTLQSLTNLLNNPCLKSLTITSPFLREDNSYNFQNFFPELKNTTFLKHFSWSSRFDYKFLKAQTKLFYEALEHNKSITCLSITNYQWGVDSSQYIVPLIRENFILQNLQIQLEDCNTDLSKIYRELIAKQIYGNISMNLNIIGHIIHLDDNPYLNTIDFPKKDRLENIKTLLSKINEVGPSNRPSWRKNFSDSCGYQFKALQNVSFFFVKPADETVIVDLHTLQLM